MQVSLTDIYVDYEDELRSIEAMIATLDKIYLDMSAKWMWLDSEWAEYVVKKVQLKKRLRKIKEKIEYNNE